MDTDQTLNAERERLMENWAQLFDSSLLAIGEFVSRYRNNSLFYLVSKQCGSFNFSVRVHWDDQGPDWLIRFPIPGKARWAEEKSQNEVAVMKYIKQNTSIPVPDVVAYGGTADNPTGLGPFIIMTWIEGQRMKEILEKKPSDTEGGSTESVLNLDTEDHILRKLYAGIADVLLELWSLDFDKIGSLVCEDDKGTKSWTINRRPLSLGINEMVRFGGIPEEDIRPGPFSSTLDYFFYLSEMRFLHLKKQQNSVFDSRDARAKFACRYLFKSIIPHFVSSNDINGPFKLFCDDFGPGNILVDPSTLKITGVIDWEFCYTAPSQFLASPPSWLLLKHPDHWVEDEGLEPFLQVYRSKFDLLLQAIEDRESKQCLSGAGKLSIRMRQSLEDSTIWFNLALKNGWSTDFLYWNLLDSHIYGPASTTERVARATGSGKLHRAREDFVRSKLKDLQRYKVEVGDEIPVDYQHEEEDEKIEHWLPPTNEVNPILLISL